MKSSLDLPEERLATTDETGKRVFLYTADVRGKFRNLKNWVHSILILFFLVLPWIRIGGHQAVLLDIPQRRFALFGLTFWAHDAPKLVFVLTGLAFTFAFVTAIWGRIWCGWACPQTVFIDTIFRRLERWIEGTHIERRKISQEPFKPLHLIKRILKWSAFTGVTLVISHSFLAYFVGTDRLAEMVQSSPSENPATFAIMAFITGVILFDFGWFREQFCIIMCPYGRFQSALMDDQSMIVAYDEKRGEPRKGKTSEPNQKTGDCVNCYRCVQVCPTGIDIRRGVQMECVACTACIDACDEIMEKVNKPKGLIRYDTAVGLKGEAPKKLRTRTIVYLTILAAIASGLIYTVATRNVLEARLVRGSSEPYHELAKEDGTPLIINHFKVHMSNLEFHDLDAKIELPQEFVDMGISIVTPMNPLHLKAGKNTDTPLFVHLPKSLIVEKFGRLPIKIHFSAFDEVEKINREYTAEVTVVGPNK